MTQALASKFTPIPYELGAPQGNVSPGSANFATPKIASPTDTRSVRDVHAHPHIRFYDPATLHFPEAMAPVVPGGPVTMGLMQPVYDHQPQWDRGAFMLAGPVRKFFRRLLWDNRVKHV